MGFGPKYNFALGCLRHRVYICVDENLHPNGVEEVSGRKSKFRRFAGNFRRLRSTGLQKKDEEAQEDSDMAMLKGVFANAKGDIESLAKDVD